MPSALLSYTGQREVRADGTTLAEVLADLERHFPGIRFFVNGDAASGLSQPRRDSDELVIVQALSGG